MPYKIRESYKYLGIGPRLVTETGETLDESMPIDAIDHFFAIGRTFYASNNNDYMSTPVEIGSYNDKRKYIVRMGDIYEDGSEHPDGWSSNDTHIKNGAHVCPQCGSTDTEGQGINVEGNKAFQNMSCNNEKCQVPWTNIYELIGYQLD